MAKKCPPGVLCIENVTLTYLTLLILFALFILIKYGNFNIFGKMFQINPTIIPIPYAMNLGNTSTGNPHNVLLNPHTPPLRNNGLYQNTLDIRGHPGIPVPGVPINMKTRGYDDTYRQVGILTRINGAETILPLMGRPLHANRGKWQFYTMNDKNNSIKLPLSKNGRSCTSEYGCDDFFNGDSVYVEGYNDAFKVTIYENDAPRYIPY
tara:strand:- start:72 stop:695 length:624 start_codon:yes stop_codon:yes gene_type:complete